MVDGVEIDSVLGHLARRYRLRMLEALAETRPEDLVRDHQLVAGHGRFLRIILGVYVDQLDDPVRIGAGSGGEQMRYNVAGYAEIIEPQVGPFEVVSLRPLGRRHDCEEAGLLCGSQALASSRFHSRSRQSPRSLGRGAPSDPNGFLFAPGAPTASRRNKEILTSQWFTKTKSKITQGLRVPR